MTEINKTIHELNARRLLCPMPVIKTQNAIKQLQVGDQLKIICTDPGVVNDIPSWCRLNGHQVLNIDELEHDIEILVEVGG